MKVTITPTLLQGTVTPPPSKSQSHRLLIAAALSQQESRLSGLYLSKDIQATLNCMSVLGAEWAQGQREGDITVTGAAARRGVALPELDCGESGSTLRFLIPVALALRGGGIFTGHGRLLERPMEPYRDLFTAMGIEWYQNGGVLTVRGELVPGRYPVPGNVSSQFITGLLYALPLLAGDSVIELTSPLESAGYVDMTVDALSRFGVFAAATSDGWRVRGGQKYLACDSPVEADYSQAAFYCAMQGMGCGITLAGLNPQSLQGDRVILQHSARLRQEGEVVIDVSGCPDLVPALAAQAALRPDGAVTRLVNAARLRMKESDRLASSAQVLNAMGASVEEYPDSLTVRGKDLLAGGVTVDCCNDHRIAMMAAAAAVRCAAPVTLLGAQCVEKSYPTFWQDYRMLGGRIETEDTV